MLLEIQTVDFGATFSTMWSFLLERFVLIYTWLDQITIGGISLFKIGIGLSALTLVVAVLLPSIRVTPVDAQSGADAGVSLAGGAVSETAQRAKIKARSLKK